MAVHITDIAAFMHPELNLDDKTGNDIAININSELFR